MKLFQRESSVYIFKTLLKGLDLAHAMTGLQQKFKTRDSKCVLNYIW